jgi:hypothetical protein
MSQQAIQSQNQHSAWILLYPMGSTAVIPLHRLWEDFLPELEQRLLSAPASASHF